MVNQVSYRSPRPCCSNVIKSDQILSMQWHFVPHDTLGSERIKQKLVGIEIMMLATIGPPCGLVQSLNSPFFPPPIAAEPGRAKRESRITCMRMLRTPPFSPPNRRKTIFGSTSRFRLWRDYTSSNFCIQIGQTYIN